jgi:hypothetical protein
VVADFLDLRRLQILTDKLRKLVQILRLNIRVGHQLTKDMSRIEALSSKALHKTFDGFQSQLERFLFGQDTSVDRVESLIARSSGILQLVSKTQTLEHQRSSDESKFRYKTYRIFALRKQTSRSISRCRS